MSTEPCVGFTSQSSNSSTETGHIVMVKLNERASGKCITGCCIWVEQAGCVYQTIKRL